MISTIEELNRLPLGQFPTLFKTLPSPERASLRGLFRGSFVGPAWLRRLDLPLLSITGLGGWWGKDFDSQGNAVNLVQRGGQMLRRFPMTLVQKNSYLTGEPGLSLRYAAHNPFPWPLIVDELRQVSPELILGMTLAPIGPLRRLALPFVLQPQEKLHGL